MFEWDAAKSVANLAKHGIDFAAALPLWEDTRRVVYASLIPTAEPRLLVTARLGDRVWTAVFTKRGETIRIISVRRARQSEERLYERQQGSDDQR